MVAHLAAFAGELRLKPVFHVVTACVVAFLAVQVKVGFLWVVAALAEFVACELVVACSALELDDAGEKLPEEISPGNFLSSQRQHEFIELEAFVSDVR